MVVSESVGWDVVVQCCAVVVWWYQVLGGGEAKCSGAVEWGGWVGEQW